MSTNTPSYFKTINFSSWNQKMVLLVCQSLHNNCYKTEFLKYYNILFRLNHFIATLHFVYHYHVVVLNLAQIKVIAKRDKTRNKQDRWIVRKLRSSNLRIKFWIHSSKLLHLTKYSSKIVQDFVMVKSQLSHLNFYKRSAFAQSK